MASSANPTTVPFRFGSSPGLADAPDAGFVDLERAAGREQDQRGVRDLGKVRVTTSLVGPDGDLGIRPELDHLAEPGERFDGLGPPRPPGPRGRQTSGRRPPSGPEQLDHSLLTRQDTIGALLSGLGSCSSPKKHRGRGGVPPVEGRSARSRDALRQSASMVRVEAAHHGGTGPDAQSLAHSGETDHPFRRKPITITQSSPKKPPESPTCHTPFGIVGVRHETVR